MNANLLLGYRQPEIQPPEPQVNMLARALQIKSLSDKSDEYSRGLAAENALNTAYRNALGPDGAVDQPKLYTSIAEAGYGSRIPDIQKKLTEAAKAKDDIFKAAGERYQTFKSTVAARLNDPNLTREAVLGDVQNLVLSGSFDGGIAQRLVERMPQDPAQLREYLRSAATSQMTPEQMMTAFAPKPTQMDNGQQVSFRDTNPNSPTYGQTTAGAPVQKVATPGDVLSAQTSEANNRRSVAASYDNAKATRDAAQTTANATRDAAVIKDRREAEMKLADDYRTESKGFAETSTAMKKVMSAIETADKNPGAALAAGTGFMKILDPTSVVRETELGMALNASGWFDRAANVANTLQHGRTMTPHQKDNLRKAAQDLFEEAKKAQLEIDGAYRKRATDYGLDPKRVIVDRGQNAKPVVDLGALPAGGGRVIDFGDLK